MSPLFEKVSIIGVGLIGGSIGMALDMRGLAGEIVGTGSRAENLRLAAELGAVHTYTGSLSEGVAGADLVVIATPVSVTMQVLKQVLSHLAPGTVVTDVGSTKAGIVFEASKVMPPGRIFVGGHPMAGSEQIGVRGADPYLFENAFYVVTPLPDTAAKGLETVEKLAEGIGARVVLMDPVLHDLAVAAVSHLPHLLAAALVNTVARMPDSEQILPLAAGGFRDVTRIAAGNPSMWRDIFAANREQVLQVLAHFRTGLDRLEKLISSGNDDGVYNELEEARKIRSGLPGKTKGCLPGLYEAVVTVPDRPGAIAGFASHLAVAGINISDIEILRVREGEGGTVRVGFATAREREEAVRVLKSQGYTVRKR
ncbi:MAG TPA: prephenate dehydrogenase [Bacillota bacterium]|nr:prephenate dehydrogenase [Bacillota bacterium]